MMFIPRPKGLGSEKFLKLNDKEEVSGFFKGEIYIFNHHWSNKRGVECTGTDCPICAIDPDNRANFRFRVNFIISNNDQWIPKIFESNGETYDSLVKLDRKYDLTKTLVEITRSGVQQNTKYHILPVANYPITKEMQDKLNAVTLLPLSRNRIPDGAEHE
jgi:hypothetical protein